MSHLAVLQYIVNTLESRPAVGLARYEGGNHFTIRYADELLERAGSKGLAGWGQAKQAVPNA